MAEIADCYLLRVAGVGKLVLSLVQQPSEQMTATLDRIAHVPELGRILIPTR